MCPQASPSDSWALGQPEMCPSHSVCAALNQLRSVPVPTQLIARKSHRSLVVLRVEPAEILQGIHVLPTEQLFYPWNDRPVLLPEHL